MNSAPPLRRVKPFGSYLAVGAVGTALHYLLMVALIEAARLGAVLAATCGFAAGAAVNYLLNYHYTFRSQQPHAIALPRFLVLALLGAAVNATIVNLGIRRLAVHYLLAQVIATSVVVVVTYIGNKTWSFRSLT